VEYFNRARMNKDGLRGDCKDCERCYKKQYREENREKLRAVQKKWYKDNREKMKATSKKWHWDNREQEIARMKKWREDNQEQANAHKKKWAKENPEKVKAASKKYRDNNRERRNEYCRERRRRDPEYKLAMVVRKHASRIVKAAKLKKEKRSSEYLGCTILEFREHIESHFEGDMSWDNYGVHGWHIDHDTPLDWFIKNSDDPFKANHYTNLKPMWATHNLSKGARYEEG